ncbi:MAG: leucine-rich repeat domain-containing protein [Clostridia bacterium]|nr:leucine-rich repeat domain-containing protein [Clostridia bacterium]
MTGMDLVNAFGFIDDSLVFDAANDKPESGKAKGFGGGGIKNPKPDKPPRGGVKAKALIIGICAIVAAVAIVFVILFATGVFSSSKEKQIPVYQGMTISAADGSTASASSYKLASGELEGSSYYGDYEGKDNDIDYEKPYGDNTPTIEQEVESTLLVTGAGESIYYASVDEDIYITVIFSNPDGYEILSFIINGTKYTSYMFESGSDLENIIIKVNVGSVAGIIEYTISEIKYVDGTEIKDVALNGDTVIKCGVRSSSAMTYTTVSQEEITLTSISFTANIVDLYDLIEYSDGYIKAVLYDGESLVSTQDLALGSNTIQFTGLSPNTLYQYAVVAYYDDLSGSGTALNYLYTNSVYTAAVVLFDDVTVGQEGISFGYSWYTGYTNNSITKLTLTGGGATTELSASAQEAGSLLSDTEYTLTAYYVGVNSTTESISLTFTTLAKAVPTVEISSLSSSQDGITYSLIIADTDNVGSITSVTATLNGEVAATSTSVTGTLSGLLSDNTYMVKVVYTYNLNDGTGDHTAEVSQEIATLAKAEPIVEISSLASTQEEISYKLAITDTDNVGSVTSVTATLNGEVAATSTSVTGTLSNLLSDNTYTVKVVYTYNLNDGTGDHTAEVSQEIATLAKATPTVEISSISSTQEEVSYKLAITDTDSVGSVTSVTATLNGEVAATSTAVTGTLSNLLSDNTYTVKVVYTYNLNDGTGDHTAEVSQEIATLAKATPVVGIKLTDSSTSSLTFGLSYTDTDEVGSITAIGFYNGDTLVQSVSTSATTASFASLTSYTQYSLVVSYSYDLNDGQGTVSTSQSLSVYTDPVIEFQSVKVLNTSAVSENETIILQATMNNPSGVTFKSVVVNGATYSVSSVSTQTSLRAEILNDGQFAGGDTDLTITQIICTIGGNTYTVDVSSNNTASVFINGELTVQSLAIARKNDSGEYEETNYGFASEQLYYMINLSNATEYNIYSVTIGSNTYDSNDITISEDYQTVYIAIESDKVYYDGGTTADYGVGYASLSSISYSNTSLDKTKSVDLSASFIRLSSDSIVEITTADDLLKVDGYEYYKLMNNIDLDGKEWANMGNDMYGVFDGNGYTISNMSSVTTYSDTDLYLGLFKYACGVVINLNITDALYMVTVNNTTGNIYDIYAGGITAYNSGNNNGIIFIDNCSVDISMQITTNNKNSTISAGGVTGFLDAGTISLTNININATISINAETGAIYIGGLFGGGNGWEKTIITDIAVTLKASTSADSYFAGAYYAAGSFASLETSNLTADCTITDQDGENIIYGVGDYEFTYENGTYILSNYVGSATSLTLPETFNGNTYIIGSYAFQYSTTLEYVVIPEGITRINEGAFQYCTSLVSITIPSTVTYIDERAFEGCTSLVSIVIPEGVTTIGSHMFRSCTSLESVTLPSTVTSIGNSVFYNCTSLVSIVIPDGVTSIGDAFYGCTSLVSIVIPDGVTTFSDYTFYGCTSLVSITIGGDFYYLGTGVFAYCTALNTIYFNGTAEEFDSIDVGDRNTEFTSATVYYYSESEPTQSGNYWHYVDGVATAW